MSTESTKRPFVAKVVLLTIFVLDEFFIFLVDGIIGQMHVLVVFVNFGSICFACKSGQTFLKDVDTERLVASYKDVDTQVEFMAIDEQWVRDISWYDRQFINIDIIDVVDKSDSSALSCIGWFDDPNVLLTVVLFQFLIVLIKFTEFIWQDVSIRSEVKVLLAISLLHPNKVKAQPIFTCYLMTLREMVDLLIFIQAFIQIALAATRTPQNVPFMALCWSKASIFQNWSNEFVIKPEHFKQQFTILNMIALLVSVKLNSVCDHLFWVDVFEDQEVRVVFVVVISSLIWTLAIEETTSAMCSTQAWAHSSVGNGRWAVLTCITCVWQDSFVFILQILKFAHYFSKLPLSFFLLDRALTDGKCSFTVDEITGSRSTSKLTVDALPLLLEVALYVLESIKSRHLAGFLLWWCLSCWCFWLDLAGCLAHALLWTLWMPTSLTCCCWVLFLVNSGVRLTCICKMCWILTVVLSAPFHLHGVLLNLSLVWFVSSSRCWCWLLTVFFVWIHISNFKINNLNLIKI